MEKKFERKIGSGALFQNQNKKSDKHPDMTGTLLGLDGVEYSISAWTREGHRGKYLSLSIRENKPQQETSYEAPKPTNETPTSDFPF